MTLNTPIRTLTAAAALLVCFGCTGAVESDEKDLWTVSDEPADQPSPSGASDPAPSAAPREQLGRGTLVPPSGGYPNNQWELYQNGPDARESVCVTVDAGGDIAAMDEVACTVASDMHECAPGDCPWIRCGGCLIYVDRPSADLEDGTNRAGPPWLLSATRGAATCMLFDGTYEVYADATCGGRSAK